MSRYHVGRDGTPKICKSLDVARCPLGGNGHYDSIEETREVAEKINAGKSGGTFGSARLNRTRSYLKVQQEDAETETNTDVDEIETETSFSSTEVKTGDRTYRDINVSKDGKRLIKEKTIAENVRIGDVIHGEKFINGKWIEDDAVVAKVETEVLLETGARLLRVTYDDGGIGRLNGKLPITVKRPEVTAEEKVTERTPMQLRTEIKKELNEFRGSKDEAMTDERYERITSLMKDPSANEMLSYYAYNIGEIMKQRNPEDSRAEELIKLSNSVRRS